MSGDGTRSALCKWSHCRGTPFMHRPHESTLLCSCTSSLPDRLSVRRSRLPECRVDDRLIVEHISPVLELLNWVAPRHERTDHRLQREPLEPVTAAEDARADQSPTLGHNVLCGSSPEPVRRLTACSAEHGGVLSTVVPHMRIAREAVGIIFHTEALPGSLRGLDWQNAGISWGESSFRTDAQHDTSLKFM